MAWNRRELLLYTGAVGAAGLLGGLGRASATSMVDFPFVTTSSGRVSGYWASTDPAVRIAGFKGIAYGADTRLTRFRAPRPAPAWAEVRACTEWGGRAPQQTPAHGQAARGAGQPGDAAREVPMHFHLPPDEGVESEDCLHLNVWTPQMRSSGRGLPVVVYFHGGAYNNGTVNAQLYDGTRLARQGVVVVTVNHRLNAFGYLELGRMGLGPEYAESGNAGMLDLVLALTWVQTNIAAFGGDRSRVTIFGQSGGGAKCATLMAMERARGLFDRVLTMSGQQVWAVPMEKATPRAKRALEAMGIGGAVTREALDKLTMEQIQAGARTMNDWLPVNDGVVLKRDPFDPDAPAMSAKVPMILGNTKDEIMGGSAWQHAGLTWETLPAELAKRIDPYRGPYTVEQIVAAYRGWYPAYKPVDVYVASVAASRSWPGQVLEAERRARHQREGGTWVYQMNYGSPTADGRAPHSIDIPFMFDNVELAPGMVGAAAEDVAAAQVLATKMSGMLVRYAATGRPEAQGLPHWPVYSLEKRETMMFDRVPQVVDDPRGRERVMMMGAGYRQPGT